ncbi:unnamed protein product [Amoebophrya sp. A120]|nr:unnamed protein product [Amoebophrya sp. A120]CAD7975576.1 unnamed protein product [Amoebophrya sp. A120]|eukprot:GSA120T00016208001.1
MRSRTKLISTFCSDIDIDHAGERRYLISSGNATRIVQFSRRHFGIESAFIS